MVNDLGAAKDGAGADGRAADLVVKEIQAAGGRREVSGPLNIVLYRRGCGQL